MFLYWFRRFIIVFTTTNFKYFAATSSLYSPLCLATCNKMSFFEHAAVYWMTNKVVWVYVFSFFLLQTCCFRHKLWYNPCFFFFSFYPITHPVTELGFRGCRQVSRAEKLSGTATLTGFKSHLETNHCSLTPDPVNKRLYVSHLTSNCTAALLAPWMRGTNYQWFMRGKTTQYGHSPFTIITASGVPLEYTYS